MITLQNFKILRTRFEIVNFNFFYNLIICITGFWRSKIRRSVPVAYGGHNQGPPQLPHAAFQFFFQSYLEKGTKDEPSFPMRLPNFSSVSEI